jgi:hypothetical protein
MHLLFDIFVSPPAVIAGAVFIATWNPRDAVIAFRVAFFMCPVCFLFVLNDRGPEGIVLLFVAVVFAIFWSRVMRLPSAVDYMLPSPPPVPPRSVRCAPRFLNRLLRPLQCRGQ